MFKFTRTARRPQRLYALVMWILSFVFAAMLTGLGGLVIADLPRVETRLTVEQFVEPERLAAANARIERAGETVSAAAAEAQKLGRAARTAASDYRAGRAALQAWLAARSATEADEQNEEVISRTRAVEALRLEQRAATLAVSQAGDRLTDANAARVEAETARRALLADARDELDEARRSRDFKVFLYRLALTLPLLAVAGYLVMRKRESSYWPLYRGFVLFALFAFFVELVPYLPSYGGYVRYIVGIAIAILAGHYVIRAMQGYLARQREAEARSEKERRGAIEYETALKKIGAGTCPGCDRPIEKRDGVATDFCVHCGIMLQAECGSCGTRNVSFHHYCLHCGTPMEAVETQEAREPDPPRSEPDPAPA